MNNNYHYQSSTGAFFVTNDTYPLDPMPEGLVEITEELYNKVFSDQTSGKKIVTGSDGYPTTEDYPPILVPKPSVCTPAQGLVALYTLKGITDSDINAIIDAILDPVQRYTAFIAYTKASEWRRESAMTSLFAATLNLTEEELDTLFAVAVTIQV